MLPIGQKRTHSDQALAVINVLLGNSGFLYPLLTKSLPPYSTWIFVNLAGMGLYLLLASSMWPIAGEEGTPGGPGDAFYVIFLLWPFLLFILVIHVVLLFRIIFTSGRKRNALLAWAIVAALWGAVLLIDHAKHSYIISAEYT